MNKLYTILSIVLLARLNLSITATFCSVVCGRKTCINNNPTPNGCTGCNTNWVISGNTCVPNSLLNYNYFDESDDLGGTLVISPVSAATPQCNGYSFYGFVDAAQIIRVSSSSGIPKSFYQMIVYFGIFTMDAGGGTNTVWNPNTFFFLNFTGGDGVTQTNMYKLTGSTYVVKSFECGAGSISQHWNKVTQSYNYGTSNVSLGFDINNNQTNLTDKWGIKQFIIIYRGCNTACLSCFGPLNSQCYSCVYDPTTNSSWLSGTTCSATCLSQYGYTTNTSFCVKCDPLCTTCFQTATNCMSCTISGQYMAFHFSDNNSCLNPCPQGYFANKSTQTCDTCNPNCTGCIYNANYCTACITGLSWYKFSCYNDCPSSTFLETNITNCTDCDIYCQSCVGPSTLCSVCQNLAPYISYLYNTSNITGSCVRACPQGYYPQNYGGVGPNLCLACDISCYYCTSSPSPCQLCTSGYYLYNQICYSTCPNGFFESNATGSGQCLDCDVVCVDLTISMYFSNSLNNQMYIDLVFSQKIDFTTFDYINFQTLAIDSGNMHYTLDMFDISYKKLTGNSYRIILKPTGYIFLYNATFTVTTRAKTNITDYSLLLMPFKESNYLKVASLTWFLIQGPPFSQLQTNIMTSFATLSQKTINFMDLPYIQEIKKSGVFNLLFSGAQITSCSVLANQIQSQNLYEGVRFWAIFVFFDVPPYEQISNQTKNFFVPSVESMIRNAQQSNEKCQNNQNIRKLFSTDVMYWRFQRTGQTSFFIYDCYLPVFLLVLCWISLLALYKIKKTRWYVRHAAKVYSAVHKVHEISIIYVTMASIVEFIYFQPTSLQRFVSAGVCILFNIYFVGYQLYIYYDMLKYPLAEIGNSYYDYYVTRYGCFLKNIRYQEYYIYEKWSPSHWLRPYNFHLLSYYKKFLMMIALPLFYSSQYVQMSILLTIQLFQLLRVWSVWPFFSKARNYLRVSLEIALALFFLINIIQNYLTNIIQSGDISEMGQTISIFYGVGWAGFCLCFYFNLTHLGICIYDFIKGLKASSRVRLDLARKRYYYEKIKEYQKNQQGISKELVNKWVKLGNLNEQFHKQLPEINIRIEQYCLRKIVDKLQLSVRKIKQLKMMKERNHRRKNNTVTNRKIEKRGFLIPHKHRKLYSIFNELYQKFANYHIETVIIKTFINVFQPDFSENQEIPFDRSKMLQKLTLISYDNEIEQRQLPQMLQGFPLCAQQLIYF